MITFLIVLFLIIAYAALGFAIFAAIHRFLGASDICENMPIIVILFFWPIFAPICLGDTLLDMYPQLKMESIISKNKLVGFRRRKIRELK